MNPQELLNKRREQFIETRSVITTSIDNYMARLGKVDQKLLDGIKKPNGQTAKEILPSLWQEPFNMEQYKMELQEFQAFVDAVDVVAAKINNAAMNALNMK